MCPCSKPDKLCSDRHPPESPFMLSKTYHTCKLTTGCSSAWAGRRAAPATSTSSCASAGDARRWTARPSGKSTFSSEKESQLCDHVIEAYTLSHCTGRASYLQLS
ncbi:hypothetical protein EVAR_69658_1 [Eumeta japonica]|uniref:Uncharacterized protein n=1 Tax=Eumeta variegata TaxID=151549 RepID=A0A4C2A6Y6_EUMVA|nr:hypothetical protein EVAR_69658_1 [Eumeta japonica]